MSPASAASASAPAARPSAAPSPRKEFVPPPLPSFDTPASGEIVYGVAYYWQFLRCLFCFHFRMSTLCFKRADNGDSKCTGTEAGS